MAEVVVLAPVVRKEIHCTVRRDKLRVLGYEICIPVRIVKERTVEQKTEDGRTGYGGPECRDRALELIHRDCEP